MAGTFEEALARLERASSDPGTFSYPFVEFLPVTGASVATLGAVLGSETLSATDDRAARLDELQFDLGEGPCWDALRAARPVIELAFAQGGAARWPALASAVRGEPIGSVFAFPLAVGPLRFGAVDLYSSAPTRLGRAEASRATALAEVVSRHILRAALDEEHRIDREPGPLSRRRIHQATGIVLAQLGLTPEDARLVIHGHAFATERSVMEIAEEIVEGTLRFARNGQTIEVDHRD